MNEEEWERDEEGSLRVSMLTGFATAISDDGFVGVLRVTFADDVKGAYSYSAQLAMRESSARDIGFAMIAMADQMKAQEN